MDDLTQRIQAAADFLRCHCSVSPDIVVILGSGWGGLADQVTPDYGIAYEKIPHFPKTTVPGHSGRLVIASIGGRPVAMLQGRFHLYEGYSPQETTLPLRVLAELGARFLIVTNAAGGLDPKYCPGDLMIIRDHLNLLLESPLRGLGEAEFGSRFIDMVNAYPSQWRSLAQELAQKLGITCHEGVYAAVPGPSYETPAEIKMLRILGADAVGMSTVPEVIVARQLGLQVLGLSCITNLGAGIAPNQSVNHAEVLAVGADRAERFSQFLEQLIPQLR
ncbi:purine-nucleoside phosphorylase [Candidatus Synechococcus calcipolaris G9]|uniref:Purine nucleoside phosphorylase n=1 Tax=Candidatus Synechococcus calcipolaris G9 TaxID=1497997 RepID=A0ABT6EZD9_9SYNE|nr:purine-nucleoside phosphorylase [Candidatus Synechococcus calcipolaris]MDG2990954.1 purine-nucleoside phosphorylase [Candidatus Synechococcus calcipolaris G9]